MKNILFLSTMYPVLDTDPQTKVCVNFVREWKKMGYNVIVIHYKSVFPRVYYWFAKIFRSFVIRVVGNKVDTTRMKRFYVVKDGVPVYNIPIFKFFPHGKYGQRTITRQIKEIVKINRTQNIIPDVIIGHFYNPQMEIIAKLKTVYPQAKSCVVLHESDTSVIKNTYGDDVDAYVNDIDVWGFRSKAIRDDFEYHYGSPKCQFICYSGIPHRFLEKNKDRQFVDKLRSFVFVGQLIPRKYPEVLVLAIDKVYPDKNYHICYVGENNVGVDVMKVAETLNVSEHITLCGIIEREATIEQLDRADCMIMISKGEAFGLVYLEAMSRGCIIIGSRNEGIDGIIQHGFNGFLCEAGNADELAEIICFINNLSPKERLQVSENAIATAKEFTDHLVAKKYIDHVGQCVLN